jgi:HEAT repeat protein
MSEPGGGSTLSKASLRLRRRRLLRAQRRGDSDGRGKAATELPSFTPGTTRLRLERLLARGREERARAAAAYALGFLGDLKAVDPLVARLSDLGESTEVRAYAAEALGHLLQEKPVLADARLAITSGLRDPSPDVRFWCAFAAGVLGLAETHPQLEQMAASDGALVEGWWSVGEEATWALRVLAGEEDPPLPRDAVGETPPRTA